MPFSTVFGLVTDYQCGLVSQTSAISAATRQPHSSCKIWCKCSQKCCLLYNIPQDVKSAYIFIKDNVLKQDDAHVLSFSVGFTNL